MFFPAFLEVTDFRDYRKVEKTGQGTFSQVWLCDILDRSMANRTGHRELLCIAKVSTFQDVIATPLFQQEVSVMYHLRECPHIAQIIGFSRNPETILMEYYPLGTLKDWIHQRKDIVWTPSRFSHFTADMARGLQHAHKLMIAHCDIKPANVLLKQGQHRVFCTLTDFGISNILDGKKNLVAGFDKLNLNGASFAFASPETILRLRTKREDPPETIMAGDIYSLAIVMCEMIKQSLPWVK